MTTKTITVRSEGLTLSRVIWQFLRRQPQGYLEQVLESNPGLADTVTLPVGTVITMPLDSIPSTAEARTVIKLWD